MTPSKAALPTAIGTSPRLMSLPAAFFAAVVLAYLAAFWVLDGLGFPLWGDEVHFWPTTLEFSGSAVPRVDILRSYNELNTPLPFVIWGMLEYAFGGGVFVARLFNFLLSLGVVALLTVTAVRNRANRRWAAPAVGVLLFPYFFGVSTHAYTDMLAIALVVLGVSLHLNGRYALGAVSFALAIATRQYMVAFPAALTLFELVGSGGDRPRWRFAWIAPALAASTLGGWYLFFGDFGPVNEIARQRIVTVEAEALLPRNSLYFVACVGVYFVVPMLILTRTRLDWRYLATRRGLLLAAGLLLLFVLFPPLQNRNFPVPTMGYFDRALRPWLMDAGRVLVFYAFALLAIVQLRARRLGFLFLLMNAVLMVKAHIAWDKYTLPLIVVLWYLEAAREGADAHVISDLPPIGARKDATRKGVPALAAHRAPGP